eukprot:TRINITY_DN29707_c0_g1_i1.p1 TRINITY_DN29707_c0_g1~~TRINITY_DN29707_c0_g1_i1.p1  ORF type:complete len:874 (+),score=121.71 TRINITY_DN29707_c0_g1_i1:71-2692(+)
MVKVTSLPITTEATLSRKMAGLSHDEVDSVDFGPKGSLHYRVLFRDSIGRRLISPWHDLNLHGLQGNLACICKTPAGSWIRYEFSSNEPWNPLRISKSSVRANRGLPGGHGKAERSQPAHYSDNVPWNCGVFPQTWAASLGGTAPLEVVEIGAERVRRTGEVYYVKPLGAFSVEEGRGTLAWKIVAIAADDPMASLLWDCADLHAQLPGILDLIKEWLRMCLCVRPGDKEAILHTHTPAKLSQTLAKITEFHESWRKFHGKHRFSDPSRVAADIDLSNTRLLEATWKEYVSKDPLLAIPVACPSFQSTVLFDEQWLEDKRNQEQREGENENDRLLDGSKGQAPLGVRLQSLGEGSEWRHNGEMSPGGLGHDGLGKIAKSRSDGVLEAVQHDLLRSTTVRERNSRASTFRKARKGMLNLLNIAPSTLTTTSSSSPSPPTSSGMPSARNHSIARFISASIGGAPRDDDGTSTAAIALARRSHDDGHSGPHLQSPSSTRRNRRFSFSTPDPRAAAGRHPLSPLLPSSEAGYGPCPSPVTDSGERTMPLSPLSPLSHGTFQSVSPLSPLSPMIGRNYGVNEATGKIPEGGSNHCQQQEYMYQQQPGRLPHPLRSPLSLKSPPSSIFKYVAGQPPPSRNGGVGRLVGEKATEIVTSAKMAGKNRGELSPEGSGLERRAYSSPERIEAAAAACLAVPYRPVRAQSTVAAAMAATRAHEIFQQAKQEEGEEEEDDDREKQSEQTDDEHPVKFSRRRTQSLTLVSSPSRTSGRRKALPMNILQQDILDIDRERKIAVEAARAVDAAMAMGACPDALDDDDEDDDFGEEAEEEDDRWGGGEGGLRRRHQLRRSLSYQELNNWETMQEGGDALATRHLTFASP